MSFTKTEDFLDIIMATNYSKIQNLIVEDVPEELEYKVSKFIFDRATIHELTKSSQNTYDELYDVIEGVE